MIISEALASLNIYPIPVNTIDKICIDRALVSSEEYTITVVKTQAYELAEADTYRWLGIAPNVVEQAAGVNAAIAIKKEMLALANHIYGKYGDDKFDGEIYGFIGEDYNA